MITKKIAFILFSGFITFSSTYSMEICIESASINNFDKELLLGIRDRNLSQVEYALHHGANPNKYLLLGSRGTIHSSAPIIFYALIKANQETDDQFDPSHIRILAKLLAHGAQPQLKSIPKFKPDQGISPLYCAVHLAKKSYTTYKIMLLLLCKGAHPNEIYEEEVFRWDWDHSRKINVPLLYFSLFDTYRLNDFDKNTISNALLACGGNIGFLYMNKLFDFGIPIFNKPYESLKNQIDLYANAKQDTTQKIAEIKKFMLQTKILPKDLINELMKFAYPYGHDTHYQGKSLKHHISEQLGNELKELLNSQKLPDWIEIDPDPIELVHYDGIPTETH